MNSAVLSAPPSAASALHGPLLDAYLDEAETLIEEGDDDGPQALAAQQDRSAALRTLLERQTLQPLSLSQLYRISRLWHSAQAPAQALAVLNAHGASLVQDLPAAEQYDARITLGFSQLEAIRAQEGALAALHAAIEGMEQLLSEPAPAQQSDEAWEYLASQAQHSQHHAARRRCAEARHRLQTVQPERQLFRAWDDAVLAMRLGQARADEGQADAAREHARQAMDALTHAAPGQDVDHNDWLKIGHTLVALYPEGIDTLTQQVLERMPTGLARPLQRGIQVRLARLQALALHHQGQLGPAIQRARRGRFGLTDDADDAFTCLVMDWLAEAGRDEEAAQLAQESIGNERPESAQHATRMAQKRQAQATEATPLPVAWHLALAWAGFHDGTQWVVGEQAPDAFIDHHLAEADRQAPGHPAIAALRGMRLHAADNAAQALPLLEAAVREPTLAAPDIVYALWICRAKVHGIDQALKMPFISSPCAGWCYSLGVMIDQNWQEELNLPDDRWPERAVSDLAARYYELSLVHFDAFFATGDGCYRDGDVHVYSMLCANLATYCRWALKQYDRAIELHHKGLETSPFAEHWYGLMRCQLEADRKVEFIATAEKLWHYANDYGYSRHDPAWYLKRVSTTLYELERDNEIAIWLQRLEEWWNGLDTEEQADTGTREEYLDALLVMLRNLAWSQPADALARVERALEPARATGLPAIVRLAGTVYEYAGQLERAMSLYQEALQRVRPGNKDDAEQAGFTRNDIARCKKKIRAAKPWWKVW